jgi:hypothetical protein
MIEMIIGQVWPYLLGALALLAGWFAAKHQGRAEAQRDALQKAVEASDKARKEARDVAQKVDAMGDAAVSDRLKSGWVRDAPRRD